ncbi:GTPase [Nostoc sp.]|uniref:GTPase n=1 Tax=Nostoc sp. TaxID=1180 RepID=UPI002FFB113E
MQEAINYISYRNSKKLSNEIKADTHPKRIVDLNKFIEDLAKKISLKISDSKEYVEVLLSSLIEILQISRQEKFVFLLIGRTGVGKSSLINKLMDKEVTATSRRKATTLDVKFYDNDINGVKFTIVDTPGLCDDIAEEGKDQKYIELIRSEVNSIDLLWFVTPIYEPRIRRDELDGIKIITEMFGIDIWKHSIIIFTFADKADDDYLIQLEERTQDIQEAIAKVIETTTRKYTNINQIELEIARGKEIASQIPSVAADNKKSEKTPDGKNWVAELYTQAFVRISERGTIPFLLATLQRLSIPTFSSARFYNENYTQPQQIEFDENQKQQIKEKLISVIPALKYIGGKIGSFLCSITSNFTGVHLSESLGQLAGESIGENLGEKVDNFINPVIGFFISL